MDHAYFMNKALAAAKQALAAGEFPVGCVIAKPDEVIAAGARENSQGDFINEIDHAEMIALRHLSELSTEVDALELTIYCTMEPCLMCIGAIILSGIRNLVYAYEDVMGGGVNCDFSSLNTLYRCNNLNIVPDILRAESLELFKTYFADAANSYWKGSLLARYTLNQ